jgi:hypothetical protein
MANKEVKKKKYKNEFLLDIISLLSDGLNPTQITIKLSISKQKLNYYIKQLKLLGVVTKISYGVWEVKKKEVKKLSLGLMKPVTNLHALQIHIPILEGIINDSEWEIKNKLNNWIPKYKGLSLLGGLTIRNNNNKSISVFLKSRNIELNDIDNLCFKVRAYLFDYFKKDGVILDIMNCEVKNMDLATEDKNGEGMLRKGEKFVIDLNKTSEKVFTNDKIKAKAWLDNSPDPFSAETNDKEWKREYLNMPFSIKDIKQSLILLEEYNTNLKLHTAVQAEQLKTQKSIQETLIKLNHLLELK